MSMSWHDVNHRAENWFERTVVYMVIFALLIFLFMLVDLGVENHLFTQGTVDTCLHEGKYDTYRMCFSYKWYNRNDAYQ